MISERQQEEASLYVLGALTAAEGAAKLAEYEQELVQRVNGAQTITPPTETPVVEAPVPTLSTAKRSSRIRRPVPA